MAIRKDFAYNVLYDFDPTEFNFVMLSENDQDRIEYIEKAQQQ
jgi:hypothetical protein